LPLDFLPRLLHQALKPLLVLLKPGKVIAAQLGHAERLYQYRSRPPRGYGDPAALHAADPELVADRTGRVFRARRGKAAKSIRNYLGVLHSIFELPIEKGWARENPVKRAAKPEGGGNPEIIRFLALEEVEAVLVAVSNDVLGSIEAALYLTAAMTGLRQGELLGLRWRDVDWLAGKVRVRRAYVRGEYGTTKSRRGVRAVPLADRVGAELEALSRRSAFTADDDLVFGHPHTGQPLDRSKVRKRFKAAMRAAGVRDVRFHDLRHTFGTRMAAVGVPMRTLQEWLGHADFKTTLIYADYSPDERRDRDLVARAFEDQGSKLGSKLSETESNSDVPNRSAMREGA
jgi:integrase